MSELLRISTGRAAYSIVIDEISYDIPAIDRFGLEDTFFLENASRRLNYLKGLMKPLQPDSPKEDCEQNAQVIKEFAELLEGYMGVVLRCVPQNVRKKLSDAQRMAVMQAYTEALAKERKKDASFFQGEGEGKSPDGKNSS